jgi:hypothetical protein
MEEPGLFWDSRIIALACRHEKDFFHCRGFQGEGIAH